MIRFLVFNILLTSMLLGANFTHAQRYQELVDSLNHVLERTDIHDTARAMTYINLGSLLYQENLDTMIPVSELGVRIAEKGIKSSKNTAVVNSFRRTIAIATSNIGYVLEMKGDLDGALINYRKCLAVQQDLKDIRGVCDRCAHINAATYSVRVRI